MYDDQGIGIVVDSGGNAYMTGNTNSPYFPIINAFQKTIGGGHTGKYDAFVSKLIHDSPSLALGSHFTGYANAICVATVTVVLMVVHIIRMVRLKLHH